MEEATDQQLDHQRDDEQIGDHIPVALTIAGSDCSGGAGIQADLKTFAAHGVYGESVIVSVVAENTNRVVSVQDIDPQIIVDQIDAVFEDSQIDAVKVGMLATQACMEAVVAGFERWEPRHVVLDPVMESTTGAPLMDIGSSEYFEERVLKKATVITPNIPEAERLAGIVITSEEDQLQAARTISERADNAAVLVKGGHRFELAETDDEEGRKEGPKERPVVQSSQSSQIDCDIRSKTGESELPGAVSDDPIPPIVGTSVDILWDGSHALRLEAPRFETVCTHGTGCTLSSAIAANLALGKGLRTAVKEAKTYVTGAIAHGLHLGSGHGPTNHLHYLYRHGLGEKGPLPDDLPAIRCTEIAL